MPAHRPTIIGVVVFVVLFFLPRSVIANIRINEFSPQTNPEWVELYNPDEGEHSLSGMVLYFDDNVDTPQKLVFCSNSVLAAKTYALITRLSDSYWLSNSGDTLILKKEDDTIDSISFGSGQLIKAPTGTQSASRTDTGEWAIANNASPQGDQINFVCPTSTPTPTPAPAPTNTQIPTKTPTPSITPTIKPKLTSTPIATPTAELITTITPSPTAAVLGTQDTQVSKNKKYIIALLFISVGCALLAAVFVIKNRLYLKK